MFYTLTALPESIIAKTVKFTSLSIQYGMLVSTCCLSNFFFRINQLWHNNICHCFYILWRVKFIWLNLVIICSPATKCFSILCYEYGVMKSYCCIYDFEPNFRCQFISVLYFGVFHLNLFQYSQFVIHCYLIALVSKRVPVARCPK